MTTFVEVLEEAMKKFEVLADFNEVRVHEDDMQHASDIIEAVAGVFIVADNTPNDHPDKAKIQEYLVGVILGMGLEAAYILGYDRGQQEMFLQKEGDPDGVD